MNTRMEKIDEKLRRKYNKLYPKKYKSSHTHQSKILICYNIKALCRDRAIMSDER